jgi:DNA-binding NarL/FixJ family response regulator
MYEAGFQDVLIKPASVERLISAISLASSGPLVERRLVQQETDATTREGGVWAKVHSVA